MMNPRRSVRARGQVGGQQDGREMNVLDLTTQAYYPLPEGACEGLDRREFTSLKGCWDVNLLDLRDVEKGNVAVTSRTVEFMRFKIMDPFQHRSASWTDDKWRSQVASPCIDLLQGLSADATRRAQMRGKGNFPMQKPDQTTEWCWWVEGGKVGSTGPSVRVSADGCTRGWCRTKVNPVTGLRVSRETIQRADANCLRFHWTDSTYNMCYFGNGEHFISLVVCFADSIGLAWATCVDPSSEAATQAFESAPRLALCLGDSLRPDGGAFKKGTFAYHLAIVVLEHVSMSYNHMISTGQLQLKRHASRHISYRNTALMDKLLERSLIQLPCHLQGTQMCGFQSATHLKSIVEIIKGEHDTDEPANTSWPFKHWNCKTKADKEAAYGRYGSATEACQKYRERVGRAIRKLFKEQMPDLVLWKANEVVQSSKPS
jgi:hypothetical protein